MPEASLDELLGMAARLGYAGIEPRLGHGHGIGPGASPEERRTIRRKAGDSGVAVCCIASQGSLVDLEKVDEAKALHRKVIALAGDIGCPRIRIFGGNLPEDLPRAAATDRLVEVLTDLGPEAAAAGVTLCFETHDGWCNPARVRTVMERVDHPAIGVNWDMMHPTRACGVPVEEGFRVLKPWIRHVHVHDGSAREADGLFFRPFGEGDLDVRSAFRCLVESGYDGFVSGEWIDLGDGALDIADELRRMRALETELRG